MKSQLQPWADLFCKLGFSGPQWCLALLHLIPGALLSVWLSRQPLNMTTTWRRERRSCHLWTQWRLLLICRCITFTTRGKGTRTPTWHHTLDSTQQPGQVSPC